MNEHHTKLKGDIGLVSVVKDLVSRGYFVSLPITENAPLDLIASDSTSNYRVQVKARSLNRHGTVEVHFRTSWNDKSGTHYNRYSSDDFDVLAIYALENDACVYVANNHAYECINIRFRTAKNNQTSGINFWQEYLAFPPSETIRDAPKERP